MGLLGPDGGQPDAVALEALVALGQRGGAEDRRQVVLDHVEEQQLAPQPASESRRLLDRFALDGGVRRIHAAMGRLVIHDIAPDGRVLLERTGLTAETFFRREGEAQARELSWLDVSAAEGLSADGSIMMVVATDAPLDARNLERLAMRAIMGLARTGSFASNGSGDYVIALSTHPDVRRPRESPPWCR